MCSCSTSNLLSRFLHPTPSSMFSTPLHSTSPLRSFAWPATDILKLFSQLLVRSCPSSTIVSICFCCNRQTQKHREVWRLAIQGWYDIPQIARDTAFILVFYGVASIPRSPHGSKWLPESSQHICLAASRNKERVEHALSFKGGFPELYTQTFTLHCP